MPGRPAHDHPPQGTWDQVAADAWEDCNVGSEKGKVSCACGATETPVRVLDASGLFEMSGRPLARQHFEHYLNGGGRTMVEDEPLEYMLRTDGRVQLKLLQEIQDKDRGYFFLRQQNYSSKDFRFAYGGIDRVDFEVDRDKDTVKVWFVDRYDFHPIGYGHEQLGAGDISLRPTNCVHAAAVEAKTDGAADYWMRGKATVPLSTLREGVDALEQELKENPAGQLSETDRTKAAR